MENKNLTLKQLADELGISKSYIDKIIRILNMHTELDKIGNKYVVNYEQKLKIEAFLKSKKTNTKTHTDARNNMHTSMRTESEIDFLRNQLMERNKEIENLHKILDQQQQLQLITQNLLDNQKLSISDNIEDELREKKEFIEEQEKQLAEFKEALDLKINENEQLKYQLNEVKEKTKKGFWQRLFNK